MKDLERVIENDEYQDVFEIKNTLNCLEGAVEEWKNGKLKVDDLDQSFDSILTLMNGNQRNLFQLIESLFNNFEKEYFNDFQISQRIESIKLIKTMKEPTNIGTIFNIFNLCVLFLNIIILVLETDDYLMSLSGFEYTVYGFEVFYSIYY